MSRLTRDRTAESVSRNQILRHARGRQGNIHFPCSADHEQDWQPYPVDPYSAICDDHTYIHTAAVVMVYATTYGNITVTLLCRGFLSDFPCHHSTIIIADTPTLTFMTSLLPGNILTDCFCGHHCSSGGIPAMP